MKLLKKALGIVLIVAMSLSLFACDKTTSDKKHKDKKEKKEKKIELLSSENMVRVAKDRDYEAYDDYWVFLHEFAYLEMGCEGYYQAADEEEAQFLYDTICNRMKKYPDYTVIDFDLISASDDATEYFFLSTFEDEESAEEFFELLSDGFENEADTDDYECAWTITESTSRHKIFMKAAYMSGDKVLWAVCMGDDETDYLELLEELGFEKLDVSDTYQEEE
ncbi:MAG: hypothetical protein MJ166_09220 [Clostridia bacterium]|nr:hypothetical protein [Clostridia bacterium]